MSDANDRGSERLALAIGAVAAGSAACLATYFAVGGPFGTINDIGNATVGVLTAALAWRLRTQVSGRAGDLGVATAIIGAATTVVGSALVISGTTGFLLGGLVSSVGFAGVGTWLVIINRSRGQTAAWPGRLRTLGVAAGALMACGALALPGVLIGFDDMASAPGWVWIGFVGWLGIYVLYPAWAVWFGILQSRRFTRELAAAS